LYLHQPPLPFGRKGADAAGIAIGNPLTLGGTPSAKTPMAQAGFDGFANGTEQPWLGLLTGPCGPPVKNPYP